MSHIRILSERTKRYKRALKELLRSKKPGCNLSKVSIMTGSCIPRGSTWRIDTRGRERRIGPMAFGRIVAV